MTTAANEAAYPKTNPLISAVTPVIINDIMMHETIDKISPITDTVLITLLMLSLVMLSSKSLVSFEFAHIFTNF